MASKREHNRRERIRQKRERKAAQKAQNRPLADTPPSRPPTQSTPLIRAKENEESLIRAKENEEEPIRSTKENNAPVSDFVGTHTSPVVEFAPPLPVEQPDAIPDVETPFRQPMQTSASGSIIASPAPASRREGHVPAPQAEYFVLQPSQTPAPASRREDHVPAQQAECFVLQPSQTPAPASRREDHTVTPITEYHQPQPLENNTAGWIIPDDENADIRHEPESPGIAEGIGDEKPEAAPNLPAHPTENSMYIVMITPEIAPCAKVGGLGDVILGLGRELMKRGHTVEVIAPMYSCMRYDQVEGLHEIYGELWSPHYTEWRSEKVYQGKVDGLTVNFITGGSYTNREAIYGYEDDLYRFVYFSRQALEFMYKTGRRPQIIHCHDWATGIVPILLYDIYQPLGWNESRVVYTIHNNECQGLCWYGDKLLGMVGLDVRQYHRPDRLQDDTSKTCINLMKGGIVYSNFITTVSPTYAGEMKTQMGGRGLQATLSRHAAKVGGVLNGIDYDTWNPRTDKAITANYSDGEDFNQKYENKTALRSWLGLEDSWRPIVSVVTRLTQQKGLDLIKHAIGATLSHYGQFVLLGSAPDPKVNDEFLKLSNSLKDNPNVNLYIGYHEDLSHLIYAGSDLFLVPSLYEPCGLTQMISLRYGTIPVVRQTGGLADTVFDLDYSGKGLAMANGYCFRDPNPAGLDSALVRAMRLWFDNPSAFNRLAKNGMRYDYSWKHPATDYENIYNYIKAK